MITAIVKFKVADDLSQDEILDGMANATERFKNLSGLIRKNFILDKKNGIGGGICNVVYYPEVLSKSKIDSNYDYVKMLKLNPPIY